MFKSVASFFICIFMITQSLYAGSIRISPVQIDLVNSNNAASFSLMNQSSVASNLQIRVFKWEQNENGEDILTETDEIAVSPPAIKIQGDTAYNIRVIKTKSVSENIEQAYRIIIDELPSPYDSRKVENGLQVLVRTSLPLFSVKKENFSNLSARVVIKNNRPLIAVHNQGSRHELIQSVKLNDISSQKGTEIEINTVNGYVLAGKTKYFPIQGKIEFDTLKIALKSNNKTKIF